MRGVGPMLPVVAGKERLGRSSSIWNLRRNKRTYFPKNPSEPALSEPTSPALKRDSGVETSDESTSVSVSSERSAAAKSSEWTTAGASSKNEKSPSSEGSHHRRDPSLILNFDVEHAAQQVRNDEISDLDLALFAFWIRAKDENYFTARKLIRELALDQGYNVNKITNACIRKLLQDLHDIRPS
ncbi:hypothetical protein E8E13_007781 [Curvularia kusanoi]|uniref:Uncharacterized protein n=1 Tax=Curvularia kusanoi TaxID=90978 RepID=A0A9P4TEY4_CURKU|nr:hypothetical protein E8E13_007781 [Curvularia kusanoi]